MMYKIGTWTVVAVLIFVFSGCSMGWEAASKANIDDDTLFPAVSDMIEQQKEVVWPYLDEEMSRALDHEDFSGEQIVANTLTEQQGREYLEFCYVVQNPQTEEDVNQVVEFAHLLLDEESRNDLDQKLNQTRSLLCSQAQELARSLAPSQRAPFWKDMQKLVVQTLVLFTAGVVYACIPTVVFWGKISAATAIAVATGVVSNTVMAIWRYYQFGGTVDESFEEWLKTVTTEPELSYALAASVMAVGNTLKRGPVVTGIIICVFALYNVVDLVKPMLTKYDFTV